MEPNPPVLDRGHLTETQIREEQGESIANEITPIDSELKEAYEQLEHARERMLSAALAFCDGTISAGQLRATRELLREKENKVGDLEGKAAPVFVEEPAGGVSSKPDVDVVPQEDLIEAGEVTQISPPVSLDDTPELMNMLKALEQKMERLEEDFEQGRINASQYRAIHRHYEEQREVAVRLKQSHPESDRWRVVLEEGRTTFLLQLNEAICRCVALFDMRTRERIFIQGEMPQSAEEAMALLRTFGPSGEDVASGRMLATHTDDGAALLLIPGRYTAALAVFSQDPPGWQVRALREVHLNFEAANRTVLNQGATEGLIYPDLRRFVKS
jgi:hypothetical protein